MHARSTIHRTIALCLLAVFILSIHHTRTLPGHHALGQCVEELCLAQASHLRRSEAACT
jgi:hypothetical protein